MGVGNDKINFLNRIPGKIDPKTLDEGRFLLPKVFWNEIKEKIKSGQQGFFSIANKTPEGTTLPTFQYYINQKGDAFALGPELGSGGFGSVCIAQNIFTGKWHCMKRTKGGGLTDIELNILKQEGMYISGRSKKEGLREELLDKIQKKLQEELPLKLREELQKLKNDLQESSRPLDDDDNEILQEAEIYLSNESPIDVDILIGELIHGKELYDVINEKNSILSFEQRLALSISLAKAYESLHRKGYVYQDIKPENIIVDMEQMKCIAIDFGLVIDTKGKSDVKLGGTPTYMSLEALNRSTPNLKDDIYAIGMIVALIFRGIKLSKGALAHTKEALEEREIYFKKIQEILNRYDNEDEKMGLQYDHAGPAKLAHQFILSAFHEDREKQDLFKLIFSMTGNLISNITDSETGKKLERPALFEVLDKMKKIRFDHIKAQKDKILSSLDPEYKKLLEELWQRRGELENINKNQEERGVLKSALEKGILKSRNAQDDLDRFLLRMVDENKNNRPNLKEVQQYKKQLIDAQESKDRINKAIKENESKLLSTKSEIEKISAEKTIEIKNILKPLLDKNKNYQDRYYLELKERDELSGIVRFSFSKNNLKIAELFERELKTLLSKSKIEMKAAQSLLQEYMSLNESSTKFGNPETSEFSEMLKDTETSLLILEKQYQDKVLALPSKKSSPKKFRR